MFAKRLLTLVRVTTARQPPGRTDRAGRADQARARLLGAAVAAFAERGFHGTTTRDIAAAAGMSPAALYVHHRSKEELLWVISRAGHERTLAVVDASLAAVGAEATPRERLGLVVEDFVRHHARAHTTARVVNYELGALSSDHRRAIEDLRHTITTRLVAVIEDGVRAGVFACGDVRMTASALLSLGIDLARWYDERGGWGADEIAAHHRALALRMVGAVTA